MNPNHILDNLSTHLKNTIASAISLATSCRSEHVTPLFMLASLMQEQGSVGAEILTKLGIEEKTITQKLQAQKPRDEFAQTGDTTTALLPELNDEARKILEKAMVLAYEHGHKYIGTEHLLYGLMHVPDATVSAILKKHKVTKKRVLDHVNIVLTSTNRFPEMEDVMSVVDDLQGMADHDHDHTHDHGDILPAKPKTKKTRKKQQSALELFATQLTDPKVQQHIDPVIGREKEIDRLMNVLARRSKNNPVLIGEPGVGKTAIVEGLAKRIVEGDVPDAIRHKKIYALDMALLISGTIYRGEFEARLKQLIDDIAAMPHVILFIDELHNIIGAGSNQGTMDAANILKPALARGQLRCIGATTLDEYSKYIASDPALERRFQSIDVAEPSPEEAIKILSGIKKHYEGYHSVDITPEAITTAVQLSTQYIHDNHLPDKAIDLLDEAAASVRMKQPMSAHQKKILTLTEKREALREQKEQAILDEEFDEAMRLKDTEQKVDKQLATLVKKKITTATVPVTRKDVAAVLSKRLHIGANELLMDEWQRLDAVGTRIRTSLFGQDHIVAQVTKGLNRTALRHNHAPPKAAFLFVGPSGVGKTMLAKHLSETLYHDPKALIRFDMSEFSEGHSISKILGSPAGYVGHKERNRFTEQMKKRPHSVLLFDEIDKAHPDVIRLLLQILDEGAITDSAGKKLSFQHSIIVLTSNIGAQHYKSSGIGFGQAVSEHTLRNDRILADLKETFDTTILGRLTDVCYFNELSAGAIQSLIKQSIQTLNTSLKKQHNLNIVLPKRTLEKLAKKAYNKDTGARHAHAVIEDIVHDLVLTFLEKNTPLASSQSIRLQEEQGHFSLV